MIFKDDLKDLDDFDVCVGIDEVGRGSLIGDVFVCAAICLTKNRIKEVRDSKKIQKNKMKGLVEKMISEDHFFVLTFATIEQIEAFNILHSTMNAMARASYDLMDFLGLSKKKSNKKIKVISEFDCSHFDSAKTLVFGNPKSVLMQNLLTRLQQSTDRNTVILVDGNKTPFFDFPAFDSRVKIFNVVRGDEKIYQISAASIFAKFARDWFITKTLHPQYPYYGWDLNAGYGTKDHIKSIKKLGITPFHRPSFVSKFKDTNNEMFF